MYHNIHADDISIYYTHQFVQNETLVPGDIENNFQLEHGAILPGSMDGKAYIGEELIGTFSVGTESFVYSPVIDNVRLESVEVDAHNGIVTAHWNPCTPCNARLTVSYEYDFRAEEKSKQKELEDDAMCVYKLTRVQTEFTVPTFENFFGVADLRELATCCETTSAWDFNSSLGDTIKEKYETLYVKVFEMINMLQAKGAKGYFWVVTSPEVSSIFETATAGFMPVSSEVWKNQLKYPFINGQYPMGMDDSDTTFVGVVNSKLRLYKSLDPMFKETILVGANDVRHPNSHYGRLQISNFIF